MKTTTPTKLSSGQWGAAMNYIETHKPVLINSRDHHDIVMVLATDYEEMKQVQNKWIDVNERLPEAREEIIAQTKRHGVKMGRSIGYKTPTIWTSHSEHQFTHWMPLPKPAN